MRYHYTCSAEKRCKIEDLPETFFDGGTDIEIAIDSKSLETTEDGSVDVKSPFIWVVEHPMAEVRTENCPICKDKARKVIQKVGAAYIRGNGYLDKTGCMRDMNLYKLQKDDPYGYMREAGEKDHLVDKFKAAGRHQKNPIRFYDKSVKSKKPKK